MGADPKAPQQDEERARGERHEQTPIEPPQAGREKGGQERVIGREAVVARHRDQRARVRDDIGARVDDDVLVGMGSVVMNGR